jgi:hypothetical protein
MPHKDGKLRRRDFVVQLGAGGLTVVAANLTGSCRRGGNIDETLESDSLRLVFDRSTGLLTGFENKITNEKLQVQGDDFAVVAQEFNLSPRNMRLESLRKTSPEAVEASYSAGYRQVIAVYKLGRGNHFMEKKLIITSPSACRLKTVVVSKLRFSGAGLKIVKYPYLKNITYFGRSGKGGVFLGVELPFDASSLDGDGTVTLGYEASLKVKAHERLESEPIYLGVYRQHAEDKEQPDLPLVSESEAMVAMTSAIMGPPRHGLVPMACGWWCEFEQGTYRTQAQVEGDMRSLDFLAECGVDWMTDSHPWSGETGKMGELGADDHYKPGPLVEKLLDHAAKKKVKIVFWPTMNNTNPWSKYASGRELEGKPFRSDRIDWMMFPEGQNVSGKAITGWDIKEFVKANCIANEPFYDWLMRIQLGGMSTGYFSGWVMDGDFFGGGGVVIPVNCPSDQHDHLPRDSNYACERTLNRMMAKIRENYPNTFIGPMCRPPMDLGIWSNRGADGVFTLDEMGLPVPLPGMGKQPINVTMGDKLRRWSRIRVQHQFFPHYMDQPLVFAAPKSMKGPGWPSEKIDYVMQSALSCSPNQLYYLPTKAGIPRRDKAEIRKWIDWGGQNIRYLQVRKDLPQWPEAGKVDGSAHILGDRGLIFLFNPNLTPISTGFRLDRETLGIIKGSQFGVSQTYPESKTKKQLKLGEDLVWEVPAQTAVVLSIAPTVNS